PTPASIETTRSAPAMPLGRAPPARDLVSRPKGAVPWRLPAWQRRAALALTIGVMLVDVWHVSAPMVNVSTPSVPEPWQTLARTVPAAPDFRVMTVPGDV